jgi:hypothetical protein
VKWIHVSTGPTDTGPPPSVGRVSILARSVATAYFGEPGRVISGRRDEFEAPGLLVGLMSALLALAVTVGVARRI